jgi:hypothetical protein
MMLPHPARPMATSPCSPWALDLDALFAEAGKWCEWLRANDPEWFGQGGKKRNPKIVVAIPRE